MYIRECKVDGYGALRDVGLVFEHPVTVLYGPNEAGKSTLIRFLRGMLYGIPSRKDPVERAEPAFGGRHGGRILVSTAEGREFLLERYADAGGLSGRKASGGFAVRDADGTELGWSQSDWERRVLGGVSERLFRQLFAVTLDELHELHTLQGEEIGNYLYHSGLAGGASLGKARRRLAAEMDKLYRPKGATQEINRQLAAIKELEAGIRQSRASLAAYQEMERELAQVGRRLAEWDESWPSLAAEPAALRAALDGREWWLQLRLLEAEERDLSGSLANPEAPLLAEEAGAEWQALRKRRSEALEGLRQAEAAVRELRAERETLRWDDRLLEQAPELERLEAARQAAAARQEEKEALAAERRLIEDTIETLLTRGGSGWTEADLEAFCTVAAEREPLRRLQQAWEQSRTKQASLAADADRLRRQREALLAETRAMEEASAEEGDGPDVRLPESGDVGPFRPKDRPSLQQAWDSLDDEFRLLERQASTAANAAQMDAAAPPAGPIGGRRASARPSRQRKAGGGFALSAAGILAALAAALAAGGAAGFAGTPAAMLYVAAAACAVLAIIAAAVGWRNRSPSSGYPPTNTAGSAGDLARLAELRRSVEARLAALLERPERMAALLLDDRKENSAEAWRRLRRAVQAVMAEMERAERFGERSREARGRLHQIDRELESLEAAIGEENASLIGLETEWSAWLSRYRLSPAYTPDLLPELLHLAEQGESALRRRLRTEERLAALEQIQAAFRQSAAALFRVCPPPPSMEADPALAVSWLFRRSAEQQAAFQEAARLDRQLRAAEQAEREAKRRLEEAEREAAAVLAQAGELDEASYERRLRVDERRRALRKERREAELRLEAGRTPAEAADLYRLLDRHDEAELGEKLAQAEERRKAAERERAELLDRRGRLSQELERLKSEAETEDRGSRLSEMESRLERLLERYALLAVADRLLQETKAVYEAERQPEVLRLASRYFSEMTGGAYTRILVPEDTPAVLAESPDRRITDSAFLSRGTQEQLYLSMRFALAEAASKEAPLPLLLDDLFVHFDEHRLRRTVPVLGEIARSRQVLLFTCHRHVAEAVRSAMPSAGMMDWAGRAADRPSAPGPFPSETASPG